MKFKPGDKIYLDFAGSIKKVEVIKDYPNTKRYKILQSGNWERVVKECQVYGSRREILEKHLKTANDMIIKYTEEKERIESELEIESELAKR